MPCPDGELRLLIIGIRLRIVARFLEIGIIAFRAKDEV
jgi:hypothetical protein